VRMHRFRKARLSPGFWQARDTALGEMGRLGSAPMAGVI
jgi:hypothetical protein